MKGVCSLLLTPPSLHHLLQSVMETLAAVSGEEHLCSNMLDEKKVH